MDPKTIAEALAMQRSHPEAPALDILDLVMKGHRGQAIDATPDTIPPGRFGLMVAEALDFGMTAAEWREWSSEGADPCLREAMLEVWNTHVWPKFVERYQRRLAVEHPTKAVRDLDDITAEEFNKACAALTNEDWARILKECEGIRADLKRYTEKRLDSFWLPPAVAVRRWKPVN